MGFNSGFKGLNEADPFAIINDHTAFDNFYLTKNTQHIFLIVTIFILQSVIYISIHLYHIPGVNTNIVKIKYIYILCIVE